MSTKGTLAISKARPPESSWCLYEELFENEVVYLELTGVRAELLGHVNWKAASFALHLSTQMAEDLGIASLVEPTQWQTIVDPDWTAWEVDTLWLAESRADAPTPWRLYAQPQNPGLVILAVDHVHGELACWPNTSTRVVLRLPVTLAAELGLSSLVAPEQWASVCNTEKWGGKPADPVPASI
jgi:hypothetical protein